MLEIIKNPAVAVAVVSVVDVIGIIGFIIYCIKHGTPGKRMKKIAVVAACLIAADAAICTFILSSNTLYDKNGNKYYDPDKMSYYDSDNTVYHLTTDDKAREYLVSEDGMQMYIADRIYIDKDGCIMYDRSQRLTQKSEYIFIDEDGNEYYPIKSVKWQKNGSISVKMK